MDLQDNQRESDMEKKLSKSAALREAGSYVSRPVGRRTSWTLYSPFRLDDLHGPSTEHHYSSYARACSARTAQIAEIALALMGYEDTVVEIWSAEDRGCTTVREIVEYAINKLGVL